MKTLVDARGLSCPQPVILTKNAIQRGAFPIEVRVDSAASCENVQRMSEKAGCRLEIKESGDEFTLILTK